MSDTNGNRAVIPAVSFSRIMNLIFTTFECQTHLETCFKERYYIHTLCLCVAHLGCRLTYATLLVYTPCGPDSQFYFLILIVGGDV
jgi:hypothetical protein